MKMPKITLMQTGVPGLDAILGGGLPELSFTVVGGGQGSGKTTLGHQIAFANGTVERPALYCTVVGEPPLKMLRYQQQFDFFEVEKVGSAVHFRNFARETLGGDLEGVLDAILAEVEELEPGVVVVDSFSSVLSATGMDRRRPARQMDRFIHELSNRMTSWEATTFLLGEFGDSDLQDDPVFTVADVILWLRNVRQHDSRLRKVEVGKLRGGEELPGQHLYRIGKGGLRVYPRLIRPLPEVDLSPGGGPRMSTGVPGLDGIMGGGVVPGDAVIVSGPSGSGKSVLGMQFAKAGLDAGEGVVIVLFEESVARYVARAAALGCDIEAHRGDGRVAILRRVPLDLGLDEVFEEIRDAATELGGARVVIDSLSGLESSAIGAEEVVLLRHSLRRLIEALTDGGVTVLITVEMRQDGSTFKLTPNNTSYLADDVVVQRYVEIEGTLEKVLSVVKMRRSAHSRAFHRYGITKRGLVVGEPLKNLQGILTGVPTMTGERSRGNGEWGEMEEDGGDEYPPQDPREAGA